MKKILFATFCAMTLSTVVFAAPGEPGGNMQQPPMQEAAPFDGQQPEGMQNAPQPDMSFNEGNEHRKRECRKDKFGAPDDNQIGFGDSAPDGQPPMREEPPANTENPNVNGEQPPAMDGQLNVDAQPSGNNSVKPGNNNDKKRLEKENTGIRGTVTEINGSSIAVENEATKETATYDLSDADIVVLPERPEKETKNNEAKESENPENVEPETGKEDEENVETEKKDENSVDIKNAKNGNDKEMHKHDKPGNEEAGSISDITENAKIELITDKDGSVSKVLVFK